MIMKLLISMLSLLLFSTYVFGIHSDAGMSSAQFLKINNSARPAGMGGAFCSIKGGTDSLFYNPAGIYGIDFFEAELFYANHYGEFNHTIILTGLNVKNIGVIALAFAYLSYGDIPLTVYDSSSGVTEISKTSPSDKLIQLSYARTFLNLIECGISFKYIRQDICDYSDSIVAFDIGGIMKIPKSDFSLGLSLLNAGGKMGFISESDHLPLTIISGISYNYKFLQKHNLLGSFDIRKVSDESIAFYLGTEYAFKNMLFLRAGTKMCEWTFFIFGGAGYQFKLNDMLFRIDYSLNPACNLGLNHQGSVSVRF